MAKGNVVFEDPDRAGGVRVGVGSGFADLFLFFVGGCVVVRVGVGVGVGRGLFCRAGFYAGVAVTHDWWWVASFAPP